MTRLPLAHPALPVLNPPARADLLASVFTKGALGTRRRRDVIRAVMFLGAAVMIAHGLFGPQLAPKNLATVLGWVHFRGALVLGLLLVGNFFCFACPFVFTRDLTRRLFRPRFQWPRRLRNKWLSIALLVSVLFAYELLDLWADPTGTAILIAGYFAAIIVVDGLFHHAPFCKFACPIGQFNFVASLLSPFEVKAKDLATCDACSTKDCIRGHRAPSGQTLQRGCEMALYLPLKVGNLDCTFCLDCAYACPAGNVSIVSRVSGEELWDDSPRSGVGRLVRRKDLAVLVLVFTYGALLNAFGMVSPVYVFSGWLAQTLSLSSELSILSLLFGLGLVVAPLATVVPAAWVSRRASGDQEPLLDVIARHAYGLAPLGFGVWLAHYAFHFLTGFFTFVPVVQRALSDLGLPSFGAPAWHLGGMSPEAAYPVELGFLGLGAVVSAVAAFRIARGRDRRARARAAAPWLVLNVVLFAAAVWLLSQPMEMRGTFLGGG